MACLGNKIKGRIYCLIVFAPQNMVASHLKLIMVSKLEIYFMTKLLRSYAGLIRLGMIIMMYDQKVVGPTMFEKD